MREFLGSLLRRKKEGGTVDWPTGGSCGPPGMVQSVTVNIVQGSLRRVWRDGRQVPVIPELPQRGRWGDSPVVAVCGKCGRDVRRVEMYSCQASDCPVQPRPRL